MIEPWSLRQIDNTNVSVCNKAYKRSRITASTGFQSRRFSLCVCSNFWNNKPLRSSSSQFTIKICMALCSEPSVQLMMRHKVISIGYIKGPRLPSKRNWFRVPIIRVGLFLQLLKVSAITSFISGFDKTSIKYVSLYNLKRAVWTR